MEVQKKTKERYRAKEVIVDDKTYFKLQVFMFAIWFFKRFEFWDDVYQIEYFQNHYARIYDDKDWTFHAETPEECFAYALEQEQWHYNQDHKPKPRIIYPEDETI